MEFMLFQHEVHYPCIVQTCLFAVKHLYCSVCGREVQREMGKLYKRE
jgi:hypothetical protein